MNYLAYLVALLAGAGTAVQSGMNAQLRESLGHSLLGAAVNFTLGLFCLCGFVLILKVPLPSIEGIRAVPTWAWFGGIFGAFYVGSITFAAHSLGAVLMLALILTGQLCASMVIDHFGLLGFPQQTLSMQRLIAVSLLLTSLVLLKRS